MSYFRPNITRIAGYTAGEQPQAGKFIKLNTNENPYPCSDRVKQAVNAALEKGLQRYPDATATAFRQRAAELYDVEPDWILCGNGSDDILTICARAFLESGSLLRYPYPSYVLYKTLAELQDAQVEEVNFTDDWGLDSAFVQADPALRFAVVPNPNSPTGTVLPPQRLAEISQQLPCPLLADEAYAEFTDASCIPLVRDNPGLMVSRTLSKSYALAGLRFGYLIAHPEMIAQLNKVRDSYNCDALSIAAATAAIDDQGWLADNQRKLRKTRDDLTVGLERLGFEVIPSQANFVWCTHATQNHKKLYEDLKAIKILVRYMEFRHWQTGLRISVGTDDQTSALLSSLESLLT